MSKRRPLFNLPHAHKLTPTDPSLNPPSFPEEFWITALASLRYTDLLASGSFNGTIHLWKSTPEFNHLTPLFTLSEVDRVFFDRIIVAMDYSNCLDRFCQ